MQVSINIKDYLSKDEIRVHVNSAYCKAFGIIDDLLPEGYEETVTKKLKN